MTYTQTHLTIDPWAETVVTNESDAMPSTPHFGDRCVLADADCGVTFGRDEVVFMGVEQSVNGQTERGRWACGLHIASGPRPFERRFVR